MSDFYINREIHIIQNIGSTIYLFIILPEKLHFL